MCFKNKKILLMIVLYHALFIMCRRVKRVIGGAEVECGTQPNVASLRNSSSLQHTCGATIISRSFALTAAHCIQASEDAYILQLNNYYEDDRDTPPKVKIVEIIKHELYDPITRAHDVALLRIALPGDIIRLKRMLPISSFGISGECTIYGYGFRDINSMQTSEKLLAGTVRIASLDECERTLGPNVAPKYSDGMMCAVGDGIDACQGDSGSPLICADGTIEGISSYGMSCAVPGLPGVYVSIGAHLKWIRNITKNHKCL